jgi:hypothetical protein
LFARTAHLTSFKVVGFNLIHPEQTGQNVEDSGLLGYGAASLGERLPALHRNMLASWAA